MIESYTYCSMNKRYVEGVQNGRRFSWYGYVKIAMYLSLPPTRHDLTQGQKPEGRLKWG